MTSLELPWILASNYCAITIFATLLDLFKRKFGTNDLPKLPMESENPASKGDNCCNSCQPRQVLVLGAIFGKLQKYLLCFSVISNIETVMSMDSKKHQYDYLHGLRAILSFFVVFCHYRSFCFTNAQKKTDLAHVFNLVRISVTNFFIISAMLNARLNLAKLQQGTFSWWKYIVKRYARLCPVFYAAFFTVLYMPLVHGKSSRIPGLVSKCSKADWPQTLALISAQFDPKGQPQCLVHCWYIEADIIFTIGTLPLLFLMHYLPKSTCALLLLVSLTQNFQYVLRNHDGEYFLGALEITTYYPFVQAWTIGLLTGYLLWKKYHIPKVVNYLCEPLFYVVCVFIPVVIIIYLYGCMFHIQLVWIVNQYFFCWFLLRLNQGPESLAAGFLSHRFWHPFSRVSYSTYVFHLIFAYQLMERGTSGSDTLDTLRALAVAFGIQAATFVPGILIEEPFLKLVKHLL